MIWSGRFIFFEALVRQLRLKISNQTQPDNILVDYDLEEGKVSNFNSTLADWGTAGAFHHGGTPLYAGPRTYE